MSARRSFQVVWEEGTPVVWAADRAAWRVGVGVAREAVLRADQLVHLLRRQHRGGYTPRDAAEIMLLGQVEEMLTAALALTDPERPLDAKAEEAHADEVFGWGRCDGVLSVTGMVVPRGLEGDPELSRPNRGQPTSAPGR